MTFGWWQYANGMSLERQKMCEDKNEITLYCEWRRAVLVMDR